MPNRIPTAKNGMYTIMGWAFALLACMFGVMLLVVGKLTAGIAFVLAGLLALPILASLVRKSPLANWVHIGVIIFFCVIAVVSISGTDIPPSNSVTGIKFVDQVLTLFGAFWERVL